MRNGNSDKLYKIQEFAELAGVTVRALHHYDQIRLLQPRRTGAGYRLYGISELERLEQIVALKFLGLPLKRIRLLLDQEALSLPKALRMQRTVLEQRRALLDRAIDAIREAESAVQPGRQTEAAVLKKIIEVIEMQENTDWMMQYYDDAAKAKLAVKRAEWTPELQEQWSRQWMELMADVEAVLAEDPASPRVQALADRWIKMVEGFTGGDPDLLRGVRNVYANQANWPESFKQQSKPFMNQPVWDLMHKAIALPKK